ncbi:GNAT family N-acetyltransferase [Amnibacterium setariae]|uniref:GNAT family N-acetyltransferase n=1 Tax=Amnibacterium setariae TaxID=2306585 RepID=UPI0013145EE8|nr:GNAT family N-acetyltransferase [Amnibacterium setariae]
MPVTRLRAARDADVPEIAAVVDAAFAAFVARTGIRPAPLGTDWPTTISALGALVATREDRVVGVLVLWPHPGHVLVETLAVLPAEHGTGLGSLLLDRAELTAIESGTNAVRLATNAAMTEAREFYSRRGFVERGRWTQQGYDRVHLEKRLA